VSKNKFLYIFSFFFPFKDSQKLCVTRRSAGLPHLIASLLENAPINELNDEQGLFHQTMRQLLACSERQNSELE